MITLYQRTDCPFCWKVRLALAELELDYSNVETQLGEKHPEVTALSPTGTVPVLRQEATVIWESAVILEYLDQQKGGNLFPGDPASAAEIRLLQAYSDKIVGPALRGLVFEKRSKPEANWDKELLERAASQWTLCLDWLEAMLASTWFGPDFSAADCALAARFGVAEAYGSAVTDNHPRLLTWFQGVKARPSWKVAYPTSFLSYKQ